MKDDSNESGWDRFTSGGEAALCLLDHRGVLLEANAAFCRLLDVDNPSDLAGCRLDELFDGGTAIPRALEELEIQPHSKQSVPVTYSKKQNTRILCRLNLSAVEAIDALAERLLCVVELSSAQPHQVSDEIFRSVVESSLDVVSILAVDGTVKYASPALAEVTGFPPEELVGRSGFELVHPDDLAAVMRIFQEGVEGHTSSGVVEYRYRHKNGSWRVLQSLGRNLLGHPLVNGILLSTRDVTEPRNMEAALRASEERVKLAHQAARIGDWEYDFRTETGTSSEENLRICGLEGQTAAITPSHFYELVHPDDCDTVRAAADDVRRGVQPPELEYRIVRPDGRIVWLQSKLKLMCDESGQPVRMVGINIDITQRKTAEARLRYSQDMFRRVFTAAPLGMALCDPATVRILKSNESLAAMFGYSPDEMTGRTTVELTHPDDAARDFELSAQMLNGDIPGYSMEKRYVRRDRTAFWGHLTVSCIRDDETGEVLVVLALVEDITDRKNLEEQLRQAQKMEAVGRLAGGIAHDFNNLLTVILGYANLLKDRRDQPLSTAAAALGHIIDAGDRASVLTRQLLAFSRRQVLSPELMNPNDQLTRMTEMIRRLIGEDVELTLTLDPLVSAIRVDPGQFGQIIINLAVNARDAMPSGGTLQFRTERVPTPPDHPFAAKCPEFVRILVIDSGTGMTEEVRQRVFEPFFTTKEPGKGTGLGLSTVYGIVQQSAGIIEVASEPGKGSTFELSFPAERQRTVEEQKAIASERDVLSAKVLLVEDEEGVRALAKDLLVASGLSVVTAEGPSQALEKFSDEIDLVITDVVMPEMSGPALIARLRELRKDLKVVYMSGYADHPALEDASIEDGAVFVSKPFSAARLLEAVAAAVAVENCPR